MSDDAPKPKFGLVLNGPQKQISKSSDAAALFNDSDSDTEIKKEKDATKRFDLKYSSNKSRDQRAVEEVQKVDPTVYEYDSLYDDIKARQNAKTEAQLEADKERKPKYAHKIVMSAQKRQMEKLMVDERKQAKERLAEGDEFADKETFVTAAYKKQIEMREEAKKEMEERERLDNRLKVEDQVNWRTNLHRKMLDDLDRTLPAELPVKTEVVEKPKKGIYSSSDEDEPSTAAKPDAKNFDDIKPGLNLPKVEKPSAPPKESRHRHDSEPDDDHERRRRHRRRRRHDSDASSSSESESDDDRRRRQRKSEEKSKSDRQPERRKTEKEILLERLEKVKQILKQRNDASAIFMARERFLQRKANGIAPPKVN